MTRIHAGRRYRAAALLLLGAFAAACDDPRAYNGVPFDDPAPAPALALAGYGGRTFDVAGERGKVVLVLFGYTHCPDVCPTTLAEWVKVKAALGRRAERVRFVFVSVDPERDTPEIARRYVSQFDSSFVALTGTPAQIEEVKRAWKVAAYPAATEPEGDPRGGHPGVHTMVHSPQQFLVDPEGRLRLVYTGGARASEIAADAARLL